MPFGGPGGYTPRTSNGSLLDGRKERRDVILKTLMRWGAVAAVLAFVMVAGKADPVGAQTFDPVLDVSVVDSEPETASDIIGGVDLPIGDVQFAGFVSFIPPDWGVVTGDSLPVGAPVGTVKSDAVLGLINSACNQELPVEFGMMNASLDRSDTVSMEDTNDSLTVDFAEDADGNGLDDAIDHYPEFIDRIVDIQPIRRSAGITLVAGTAVLLQFLVYPPGTLIDELIPNDPELGYPSVTFLQNAGDPDAIPSPGVITDFCTPLTTLHTTLGETVEGEQVMVNPQNGTYTFTAILLGQRDADGDGYENTLDTCALIVNVGNPRIPLDGDADGDGLDAACDPNDGPAAAGTDSDEDADGYPNRQDNCPLDANGEAEDNQADEDEDQIGDACDPNPGEADGELTSVRLEAEIIIGDGTGEGGPPSAEACPNCFVVGGENSSSGGDDDGGSDSGLIIGIIVAVIAAVVIIGGGAALMMRRREGT